MLVDTQEIVGLLEGSHDYGASSGRSLAVDVTKEPSPPPALGRALTILFTASMSAPTLAPDATNQARPPVTR